MEDAPPITTTCSRKSRGGLQSCTTADSSTSLPRVGVEDDQVVFQLPTPKTPRHRDALSKRVPVTPRHRNGLNGRPPTPRTPRTTQAPSKAPTPYHCARQLFSRSADPGRLIGRDEERKELRSSLEEAITSGAGRCVYVSGPPGTGKSALVSEICQDLQDREGLKSTYINCMSLKTSADIYDKLTPGLPTEDDLQSGFDPVSLLRSTFAPTKRKSGGLLYLVVLDEIDHLLSLDVEALYKLFEWSLQQSSRLILVGIANALDLTDRFLPRLKARNLQPQLLPFLPYTASQIATVITKKLQSLILGDSAEQTNFVPILHTAAIQLCSKKVASQTGDLRKAFGIVHQTIELVEAEAKLTHQNNMMQSPPKSPSKMPFRENPNLATSPSKPQNLLRAPLSALTPLTAPRATIAHVSRASAIAMSNGTIHRLQTLNLQQSAVLCTLIAHQKTSRNAAASVLSTPTKKRCPAASITVLYETYCGLCRRENALHPLTAIEFRDVVSGLETQGLIGEDTGYRGTVKGSTPRKSNRFVEKRIVSFIDERDVQICLDRAGGNILRNLLLETDR